MWVARTTRRAWIRACVLCGSVLCGACSRPSAPVSAARPWLDPSAVDTNRAMQAVEALVALGPRDAGTEGARRAAQHLHDALAGLGLQPRIDTFEDRAPPGLLTFHNVLARIEGQGEGLVVLVSHFDTKSGIAPDFAGANDSGSSSGLLLELGRLLAEASPGPLEVLLAFVDGEECIESYAAHDGLHGSRRLAEALVCAGEAARVRAVIVLDMVGDRDLTVTLPRNCTPALLELVLRAAREENVRERFSLYPHAILDDHVPFMERGMPAVNIIDFEFGSAPGLNDYWHTVHDTLDKLCPGSLGIVGRVTVRTLNAVAERP